MNRKIAGIKIFRFDGELTSSRRILVITIDVELVWGRRGGHNSYKFFSLNGELVCINFKNS